MQFLFANRITSFAATFLRDRLGSVLIMSGLLMPVLIGFMGLGIDVEMWFLAKREIQTVADAGAIGGAHTLARGGSVSHVQQAIATDAALNDFVSGGGNTVTVNIPPTSGAYVADSNAVETVVVRTAPLYFLSMFGVAPFPIQARAVASNIPSGSGCILALHPTLDKAIQFSGSAYVDLDCGIASNSTSGSSVYVHGTADVAVFSVFSSGDIYVGGNPMFVSELAPTTYAAPTDDPFANLTVPSNPQTCDYGDDSMAAPTAITGDPASVRNPGRYCGGIEITNSTVAFNPGVYILDQGDFAASGGSILTGTDVTFIFASTDGHGNLASSSAIGNLSIEGGTVATLDSPTDGSDPYKGVLFFQDQRADCCAGPSLIRNSILGGSDTHFNGTLYFPSQEVEYLNGSSTIESCVAIVAGQVTFSGQANLTSTTANCTAAGVTMFDLPQVRLVE